MNFQNNPFSDNAMDMENVGQDQSDSFPTQPYTPQTNFAFSTSYYSLYTPSILSPASDRNTPFQIGMFNYPPLIPNNQPQQPVDKRPISCLDDKPKAKNSTSKRAPLAYTQPLNPLNIKNQTQNQEAITVEPTRQEIIRQEARELITCLDSSFEGIQNQAVVIDGDKQRLSFDYTNDPNDPELWRDNLQDSFSPELVTHKRDSSIISLNNGEGEVQANLNSSILNDLSSIIDPGEKEADVEVNLSHHSEESEDGEERPLEKKLRTEEAEKKYKVGKSEKLDMIDEYVNLPGMIVAGVRKASIYYFTKCEGLFIECISRVLDSKAFTSLKRFELFIMKLETDIETWGSILNIVDDEDDQEMIYILLELIYELLSTRRDLDKWLLSTGISEKEKSHVRVARETIKENFVYHLYSRCNS